MSAEHEQELIEKFEKLAPIVGWMKALLVGAFALGLWVATLQAAVNTLAKDMLKMQVEIQRSNDWESEQRETSAAMKQQLKSLEEGLGEIKEILRSRR